VTACVTAGRASCRRCCGFDLIAGVLVLKFATAARDL
jgi:hypothetical protein